MKTKISFLLIVSFIAALFSSCNVMGETIKPSKNNITRDYNVEEFDQIDVSTVGEVYYTQSTDGKTSVQIYGPDNLVKMINVTVKNKRLTLQMEKHKNIRSSKLKITLSSPELSSLYFKGVGNIHIENPFTASKLDIESKGVGNIKIDNLNCDELTVSSMGVGNIELKGKTQSANLWSKGVGDIEAEELEVARLEAQTKGVGNITCYATESLKASAKGVGSIKYKGNPVQKICKKKGIGSIKSF